MLIEMFGPLREIATETVMCAGVVGVLGYLVWQVVKRCRTKHED